MLLRRRSGVSGPLLLLLGLGFCLYHSLMLAWNRVRSGRSREPVQRVALDEETRRIVAYLEAAQVSSRDVTKSRSIHSDHAGHPDPDPGQQNRWFRKNPQRPCSKQTKRKGPGGGETACVRLSLS